MTKIEKIKTLYFSEGKNCAETAEILSVSSQYVSKVLKSCPEYYTVKQLRRDDRQAKYKSKKIQSIVDKRKQLKMQDEATFGYLALKQIQNAMEMSKKNRK